MYRSPAWFSPSLYPIQSLAIFRCFGCPSLHKNNFALRSGILLVAQVGIVSFIATTVLLAISIRHAITHYRPHRGWDSSLQPVSLLFLIAIFMDSIQAIGNILNARWAFDGKVTEGSYCTTQAVVKQIGDDGAAWSTIAIAVMTFVQTMFPGKLNRSQARRLTVATIVFIFLFLLLMIIIPATTIPHYYGNTGPWCWVTRSSVEASRLRIGSQYAFYWLAATVSCVLYGTIVVKWLRKAAEERDRRLLRAAISMGWYPIAYTVEVFPISLVRFLEWNPKGPKVQRGLIILPAIIIGSSGAVNVLLWFLTGRRFGFSDSRQGNGEDRRWESYMMHILSPGARGSHSPAAVAAAGGMSHFSLPSFPEDPLMAHEVLVLEPYEPREGGLGLSV